MTRGAELRSTSPLRGTQSDDRCEYLMHDSSKSLRKKRRAESTMTLEG